ncbi:hypothetical protein Tco_1151848 [Tanacetum coccineum]
MHWMDARALRKKDAFRGERPSGDTISKGSEINRDPVSSGERERIGTLKKNKDEASMLEDTETKIKESEAEGTDSEGEESEDEGHDLEGYEAARRRALELAEEIAPSTFKVGQSSRSVLDQQVADGTPTPRIPACTTWIDPEDGIVYLDIKIDPLSCAPVQTPASPE